MAMELKNVDWSLVPLDCPWCSHVAPDKEAMVYHWIEAHPQQARRWKPARADTTSLVPRHLQLGQVADDLLSADWAPPWWVGLVLVFGGLIVPETRAIILRILKLAFQIVAWGTLILAVVVLSLAWAVISLAPLLFQWALNILEHLWG